MDIFLGITGFIVLLPSAVLVNSLGVGPSLGALLGSAVYKVLKHLNYHEVNGTQDRVSSPVKPSIISTALHDPGSFGKGKGGKEAAVIIKSEILDPSVGMLV